ncbi:M23 family metallopeptidase [Teredinibacter franksiae]|uniref:M23 family metallopeptidase n=1 Tax=Teredinibacter franksiae TaxID=2761453 RepID=UPI0016237726|nr:M23 family metallopeptidase [Teredinibacter franksiae]
MSEQNLVQPINSMRCTAGYKDARYLRENGFSHYGCDYTDLARSNTRLYSLGTGNVLEAGPDVNTGNTIIIRYNNVKVQKSWGRLVAGSVISVVCRMWHLKSISIAKSQMVDKDTTIGFYGNTGGKSFGAHLHIEFDTDLICYAYSPTFRSGTNGGIIRGGTDSSVSPGALISTKTSPPDSQSSFDSNNGYCSRFDWNFVEVK